MDDKELLGRIRPPRPLRDIEPPVGRAIGRRLAIIVCLVGRVVDLDAGSVAGASEPAATVNAAGGVDAAGLRSARREDVVVVQKLLRLGGCGGHDGFGW